MSETAHRNPSPQKPAPAAARPEADLPSSDPRLKRIAEQAAEALRNPDLLRGNLAASGCDVMDLAYQLKRAIDEKLASDSRSLDRFADVSPAVELLLRMTKQINQFAQVEARLAALHAATGSAGAKPARAARSAPGPKALSEVFGF